MAAASEGVETHVDQAVLLQTETRSGGGHELPQSAGAGAAFCRGHKRAFDYRQVAQLARQAVALEGFLENRHVVYAESQHVLYQLPALGIEAYAVANYRVERHFDAYRQPG